MQKQIDKHQQKEEEITQLKQKLEGLASHLEQLQVREKEFERKLGEKQQELMVYTENVKSYVNLRVSQRTTFSLAFELNNNNTTMINEAMVSHYFIIGLIILIFIAEILSKQVLQNG